MARCSSRRFESSRSCVCRKVLARSHLAEKTQGVGGGAGDQLRHIEFEQFRHRARHDRHVGGFVARAAVRHRGEVGAIGFQDEASIDMKLHLSASLPLPLPFPVWVKSMQLMTTSSIVSPIFALPLALGKTSIAMSSSRSMLLAIRESSSQPPPLPLSLPDLAPLPLPDLVYLPLPDLAYLPLLDLLALPLPLPARLLTPPAADAILAPCPALPMANLLPVVLIPSATSATNAATILLVPPAPLPVVLLPLPLPDLDFPLLVALTKNRSN